MKKLMKPLIKGSGLRLYVAPSYDELPKKVRENHQEKEFISRRNPERSYRDRDVKSVIGFDYIAVIAQDENHYDNILKELKKN